MQVARNLGHAIVRVGEVDQATCTIEQTPDGIRIVVGNTFGDRYIAERNDPNEAYALAFAALSSAAAISTSAAFSTAEQHALAEAWSQAREVIA